MSDTKTPTDDQVQVMLKRIGSTPFPDDLQGIVDDAEALIVALSATRPAQQALPLIQSVLDDLSLPRDHHDALSKAAELISATQPRPAEILDERSARAQVGEIGNQIHNIGCELQDNEELQERLGELASRAWKVAQGLSTEPQPSPAETADLFALERAYELLLRLVDTGDADLTSNETDRLDFEAIRERLDAN